MVIQGDFFDWSPQNCLSTKSLYYLWHLEKFRASTLLFLLLIRLFFQLVYLSSKVEKKTNTVLVNIHPCPFDPYTEPPEIHANGSVIALYGYVIVL